MNSNMQKKVIAGLLALTLVLSGALVGVLVTAESGTGSLRTGAGPQEALAQGSGTTIGFDAVNLSNQGAAVLNAYQEAFRSVSQSVMPTVVMIETSRKARPGQTGQSPFQFFFNGQPFQGNGGQDGSGATEGTEIPAGSGSGIMIAQKGQVVYVMTNNHVVEQADSYLVRTSNNSEYKAELVGADKNRDIAVLKFTAEGRVDLARLGDSSKTQAGDIVFAVGSPYGIQNTITQGIVSAVGRNAKDFRRTGSAGSNFTDYIQTDASINQGNSGGALVNIQGEVIGVNTWIATQTGGSVGLGFAVPINNAAKVATDIIEKGKVEYGWLGVSGLELPEVDKRAMNLSGKDGAFVGSVIWDSPAAKAGLRPGDLLLSIDGETLASSNDLVRAVSGRNPNTTVVFKYLRDGKNLEAKVTLGIRDEDKLMNGTWPGFVVTSVTESIQKRLKGTIAINQVLISEVAQGSAAAEVGIGEGDVITGLNGQTVKTLADYYRILAAGKSPELELTLINRAGREVTVKYKP